MTPWWAALLFGLLGAAVADGSKISTVMLTSKKWPWNRPGQRAPFAVGLLIRAGCAGALSAMVAIQEIVGWSDRPLALFAVGAVTPTVVQHGTRLGRVVVKAVMSEYLGSGGTSSGS